MVEVLFRIYAQLNDFLPPGQRGRRFTHAVSGTSSVKDTIEALGVPHPEVDLVLVNGTAVDFTYRLHDGDSVSVYPAFRSLDLAGMRRVGADPPQPIRFVVDGQLGKLGSFLRLAGFDTKYARTVSGTAAVRRSRPAARVGPGGFVMSDMRVSSVGVQLREPCVQPGPRTHVRR